MNNNIDNFESISNTRDSRLRGNGIRELPDFLINQIAAGEVVERPASVVKELVENALDANASNIVIDVVDGGRTLISVIDNGSGMSADDLRRAVTRHATSKLPDDDLLNINFMGFRGEALPSIASVSEMTIDSRESRELRVESRDNGLDAHLNSKLSTLNSGWQLDCTTGEVRPSSWESGTRVRVANLFARTPARLKFLRGDRAEMMSVVEVVKRLAMSRPDVGFILNNKWRFLRGEDLATRVVSVMGDEVRGRMLEVDTIKSREFRVESRDNGLDAHLNSKLSTLNSPLSLCGFISEPTLRRASSVDQYLFVNGRPVKDKVLVGALRAAYMDVMSAREFPLCALYLTLDPRHVDVNMSPAKTEVHFLEPARVRGFIIKTLRDALAAPMARQESVLRNQESVQRNQIEGIRNQNFDKDFWQVREKAQESISDVGAHTCAPGREYAPLQPLGRVIGQIGNKYIIAENAAGLVIVDQHAAHERITYEKLRSRELKVQMLLTPIVVKLKPEQVSAVMEVADDLAASALEISQFGADAVAIAAKPADWDMDWGALLRDIADEIITNDASSKLGEKLHLKLANYACHHSVRAGQKLDLVQMDTLLRDIENTERAGQCNHGRPVYKMVRLGELDKMFERN